MIQPQRSPSGFASVAFWWIAVLAAAGAAALASHVAIDIAANFVVAHDPYDDFEHGSRAVFLGGSLVIGIAGALAVLLAALRDFHLDEDAIRGLIGRAASASPARFVAPVVPVAFAGLLAMEWLDSLASVGRACSLTDALGGSVALGSFIVVAMAVAIGLAVWRLLRLLARSHRAFAHAIGSFIVGALKPTAAIASVLPSAEAGVQAASVLARRAGKRAPPLFA
jgi:hypothetical protein